jgi:hypothetical protein
MSDNVDDIYDDETNFLNVAAIATETGQNGDYLVEYAFSLEPMFNRGVFDEDAITSAAGKIVADHTQMKAQIAISDDDNFYATRADGATAAERSHGISYKAGVPDWRRTSEFADLTFFKPYTAGLTGDYSGNGVLDAADLDLQTGAIVAGGPIEVFDLTNDGVLNYADRQEWVNVLKKTWIGDADLNGKFESADLVNVFVVGKYETGQEAGWAEGNFNGLDKVFSSDDLVAAFIDGGYEAGERPATSAVPEPSGVLLWLIGLLLLPRRRR